MTFIPLVIILTSFLLLFWSETTTTMAANLTTTGGHLKDSEKNKPRNVVVEIFNATSINLKWEPPKEADVSKCPVLRYTIRLKTEGAKKSRTWKIDASRLHVALHDLLPDNTYYVRLLAVVCDGKGRPSRWLRVRTSDSRATPGSGNMEAAEELNAPGKPTYVRTRTFPDSVIVSWLPPDDITVIRGYMVGYGEGVPDVNWQYVEASRKNVTIKSLKPATQYIISLRAFNNFGKGPVVYDLIYTREFVVSTAGPATTPTDLRAKILSPTTAWLQWVDPSLGRLQQLTDSRYYNVHYQVMSSSPSPLPPGRGRHDTPAPVSSTNSSGPGGKTLSVIVKALHVVLYDLTPGTRYEFKVRTVKDAQASQFSEAVVNKTFETAPSSPPRTLSVLSTNSSTVVLASWRPPRLANGDVTGYLLMYTSDADLPTDKWQLISVAGNETETIVTNLWPNKTYQFKIQARNGNGYSPMSASVSHYTRAQSDAEMRRPSAHLSNNTRTNAALIPSKLDQATSIDFSNLDVEEEDDTHKEDAIDQSAYDYGVDSGDDDDDGDDVSTTRDEGKIIALAQTQQRHSKPQQTTSGEAKRKRDQTERASSSGSPSGSNSLTDELQLSFSTLVRHQISAFITWPETMESCNGVRGVVGGAKSSSVVGYGLGYRLLLDEADSGQVSGPPQRSSSAAGGDRVGEGDRISAERGTSGRYRTVERNVTVNMVVLDDLRSNSRYRFRIRYLLSNGTMSSWSREQTIDTRVTVSHGET